MADTCRYYSYEGGFFSSGNTCSVTGKKETISEEYYRRYCHADYNKIDCPLHKKYGPYIGSGCFITTVTCGILGLDDKDALLNDFRSFRNNVLQKEKKYYDVLKEYDVIGPQLAYDIINDKDRKQMAQGLYQNALLPIHSLIKTEQYDKAVEKYYLMTLMLVNYYKLKHTYNELKDEDYHYDNFNPQEAGHGHKILKKDK